MSIAHSSTDTSNDATKSHSRYPEPELWQLRLLGGFFGLAIFAATILTCVWAFGITLAE